MTYLKLAFAVAMSATTLGSTAALAQEDVMRVSIAGYDANTQEGAKIIMRRIQNAAHEFCGVENPHELSRIADQRRCVATMTAKAVDQLNAPRVTALQSRSPVAATRVALGEP